MLTKCPNCGRDYHKLAYIETTYISPMEDKLTEMHRCLHCYKPIAVIYKQYRIMTGIEV